MIRYKKRILVLTIAIFLSIGLGIGAVNQFISSSGGRVEADSGVKLVADKKELALGTAAVLTIKREFRDESKTDNLLSVKLPEGITFSESKTKELNDEKGVKSIAWNAEKQQIEVSLIETKDEVNIQLSIIGNKVGNYQLNAELSGEQSNVIDLAVIENQIDFAKQGTDESESLLDNDLLLNQITPFIATGYTDIHQYPGIKVIPKTESTSTAPYVIPGKNSFVMQLSEGTTYTAVGEGIYDNTDNKYKGSLRGYVFEDSSKLTNPTAPRYILATKVGIYKGNWIDVRVVVDEVRVRRKNFNNQNPNENGLSESAEFGVATVTYEDRGINYPESYSSTKYGDYFMAVGTLKNSSNDDYYSYHYEFYDNQTGTKLNDISGMWNFQRQNKFKQTDIRNDAKHMSSIFASDAAAKPSTVTYKTEPIQAGFDRFFGDAGSVATEDTYLTTLFDNIADYPIGMTAQGNTSETSTANGMILMYNQTPLARIYPSKPEVIGERTTDNPMRMKYQILQNIPAQKSAYYSTDFQISSELPVEYDFDLSTVKVQNVLDNTEITDQFTASYDGSNKNKLILKAVNPLDDAFNNKMYRILVEALPNEKFDLNEYKNKVGHREKQYDLDTSYIQVPLTAKNTFNTGNVLLGTVTQTAEVETDPTKDKAISYMLYRGIPDADPLDGKKVAIGADWDKLDPVDFIVPGTLRTDTGSPNDEPIKITGFYNTPDTSKKGEADVWVVIETAQGVEAKIKVKILIENGDPIPDVQIQEMIKNTTQSLDFSTNQTAHIQDELTFQGKITKAVEGSIWNKAIISITVPEGVELPTVSSVKLSDGTSEIPATITIDGRKITAKLTNSVTATEAMYLKFDTKVLDAALGQSYTSTTEATGEDSNQDPVISSSSANLAVLDYSDPMITFEPKVEKKITGGDWEENKNVKPGNAVRFTIQSSLKNAYTVWKNQKIVVDLPEGLDSIVLSTSVTIVRPGKPDVELTNGGLTKFEKIGNQIIFETTDPQYQFTEMDSRIRFNYTANVMVEAVTKSPLETLVHMSGLNSRNEAVGLPNQLISLDVTEGILDFSATDQVDFKTNDLISTGTVIHDPKADFVVNITDSRGIANAPWSINAEVSKEFKNGDRLLNGNLFFVDQAGNSLPLSKGAAQPIIKNASSLTSQQIVWKNNEGKGLFLKQRAGMNVSGSYSGEITWTLSVGP